MQMDKKKTKNYNFVFHLNFFPRYLFAFNLNLHFDNIITVIYTNYIQTI